MVQLKGKMIVEVSEFCVIGAIWPPRNFEFMGEIGSHTHVYPRIALINLGAFLFVLAHQD